MFVGDCLFICVCVVVLLRRFPIDCMRCATDLRDSIYILLGETGDLVASSNTLDFCSLKKA
jgi:hypothetical protein